MITRKASLSLRKVAFFMVLFYGKNKKNEEMRLLSSNLDDDATKVLEKNQTQSVI